ncbi:MAG: SAM-dependent DNA methyltransferase [Candidatus Poribacteria bacterium]|nr:SAM-dependent DNA methyltransferase [Candidatus Poribacteria bacterium]
MKSRIQTQFGDFQTPIDLAYQVVELLRARGISPVTVVEPTCGWGNFLVASINTFGGQVKYFGFDVNSEHINAAHQNIANLDTLPCELKCEDFYDKDWNGFFYSLPEDLLVIGNPPWVTNAILGSLGRKNLPTKSNFQGHKGFEAKTGKANFDVSEWMLIRLLESLQGKKATVAMLCKTTAARKVLKYCWKRGFDIGDSTLYTIDAKRHFGVSVDACLLVVQTGETTQCKTASVYADLSCTSRISDFGVYRDELVSDIEAFKSVEELDGIEYRKWRSGVKHDAVKIMELEPSGNEWVNGLGERCMIESSHLFPILKSSNLANGQLEPSKYVILTQRKTTDDTSAISVNAPKTWQYLLDHCDNLDRRKSSIYTKRPRFSIFGVGSYTFSPWKVAISGLYKNPVFRVIGSVKGKPITLDDTCYFIPCESKEEAVFFGFLLNSKVAQSFVKSLIFPDSKRPITIDVLKRIDLKKLSERLNYEEEATSYLENAVFESGQQKLLVYEDEETYRAGI